MTKQTETSASREDALFAFLEGVAEVTGHYVSFEALKAAYGRNKAGGNRASGQGQARERTKEVTWVTS